MSLISLKKSFARNKVFYEDSKDVYDINVRMYILYKSVILFFLL